MAVDLFNPEERKSLIDWIQKGKEHPDILINNAGIGHFGRFESLDRKYIEKTITLPNG